MSDRLVLEKADIYRMFDEASRDTVVEIDSEETWFKYGEHEHDIDDVVEDITEIYNSGTIATGMTEIKTIAAIAFCDGIEFEPMDYEGAGGERYDD